MKLNKEQIRSKIRSAYKQATNTEADVFSSDVPESVTRHVVGILVAGDGTNNPLLTINRVDESDTSTPVAKVRVVAAGNEWIPEGGMDIEQDVVVLQGGYNMSVVTDSNVAEVTVFYWDEDD